jgi:hypothetical protein
MKTSNKKEKKREIKKINCACTEKHCQSPKCLCPLHFISLKEWHAAIIKANEDRWIVFKN